MSEHKEPIPSMIYNASVGGHVTNSQQIIDENENKEQSQINAEVKQTLGQGGSVNTRIANAVNAEKTRAEDAEVALADRVTPLEQAVGTGGSVDSRISAAVATEASRAQAAEANRYTKSETYTKEEVHNLITTPNQEYVSVTATAQTIAVTDVLPATGAADTTYRVGNWDGTQYNDSVFSEYAWNGNAYIKLSTKSQTGEVYDISANHADTKYADLTAALGTNGVNIPQSLRKGGMSVKFVQSFDNKYVQCRLNAASFTTNTDDWQIINDVPVIKNELSDDLQLTDENGNVLAAFRGGGIRTKNFNSEEVYTKEEVLEELDKLPHSEDGNVDLDITDENGNIVARYKDGVHLTKYPSPYTKDNNEVFDVEDAAGNKVFRIKNGYPQTKNFDGSKLSSNIFNQVRSSIGEGQMRVSYPSIAPDANIELLDFPRYLDTRKFISFIGYMSEFPSNASFDFGFRYKYNGQYWHSGEWIRVTSTNVEVYYDLNENQSVLEQSYVHGLTFSAFVKVFIYLREDYSIYIILETINGKYVIEHKRDTGDYTIDLDIAGHPILFNNGISFSDAQITAGSADFKSPIWIFGDSYSTASYGYTRIGKQLMDLGLSQNTCYNHCGGNNHQDAWDDLQRMLPFGTPRMIVWLLGVNGVQTNNVVITDMLKELCNSKGIELVLQYPPLFPNSIGIDTTNLRNKVIETGCRIVNFSKAVGCHIVDNDAVWYEGYLAGDNVHPTELGSRALVMQIINDVPELLQWGINENPVYYSAGNN